MVDVQPWIRAWRAAATGPSGFYRRQSPYAHFTTSVADGSLARQLRPYLRRALDDCPELTVVDAGAGTGLLLEQLAGRLDPRDRDRVHWIAVDLRPRPTTLAAGIEWRKADAVEAALALPRAEGILIAHELLDDLPCDLVEVDEQGGVRRLDCGTPGLLPAPGALLDPLADADALAWLAQWWPTTRPLMRAEIGLPREQAWTALTGWIERGYAIAVDYGHVHADRVRGVWDGGTLAGYREGRVVAPRADGTVNLTAHVAMDAVAAAASGMPQTLLERSGPTPDFWRLVQAYGLPVDPDRMPA